MPPPADAQQPRARPGHLGGGLRRDGPSREGPSREGPPPAVEPARGARSVEMRSGGACDLAALREVTARVEQDVSQRAANLSGSTQQPVVIAAVEHGAALTGDPVDRSREACGDALHAAREGVLALRLDDQVRVIVLERVVHDAEVPPLARLGERTPELSDEGAAPQRRDPWANSQGHVDGAIPGDRLAPAVQHPRPRTARASRTGARPPSSGSHPVVGERELLRSARHSR